MLRRGAYELIVQQIEHRSDGFVERDGTLELELVFRGAKLLLATASHLKT